MSAEAEPARRNRVERFFAKIATAWRMAGLIIVFLIIIDLIAGLVVWAFGVGHDVERLELRMYEGAPWAPELLREWSQFRLRWRPYTYYRSRPMKSRYINIDADGIRKTWNGGSTGAPPTGAKPIRIFMFGGSTMLGQYDRDDYTIPSMLVKELKARGIGGVQITNFGQIGYESGRETIALWDELRHGNVPDLVIFYDGANDTIAAYQEGVAGNPQNEANREREFSLNPRTSAGRRSLYYNAAAAFAALSWLGQLTTAGMERFAYRRVFPHTIGHAPRGPALAADVVRLYQENLKVADLLGRSFGFRTLYYWQPVIYSRKHLSKLEREWIPMTRARFPGMIEFFHDVWRAAHREALSRDSGAPRVIDISGVLDDLRGACFVNTLHITGRCNAVVASRMARDVIPELKAIRRERGLSAPARN